MGKEWGPAVWSKMTDSSPNQIFTNPAEHSAKKTAKERQQTMQNNKGDGVNTHKQMILGKQFSTYYNYNQTQSAAEV